MNNKHVPKADYMTNLYTFTCKYCECNLIYDYISNEYIDYMIFSECISDEEKAIKDILE